MVDRKLLLWVGEPWQATVAFEFYCVASKTGPEGILTDGSDVFTWPPHTLTSKQMAQNEGSSRREK